jgi:hypothetical protein
MSEVGSRTRDERRTADRRQAEGDSMGTNPESMRANPEVMGRTEPVGMEERAKNESAQPRADKTMAPADRPDRTERPMEQEFWPSMGGFSRRLEDIQSEFINDPRAAVQKAERLVEEAVDHMAKSMREQVKRMHGDVEGNADTEKLRLMMRSYRVFIESMEDRRAA